MNRQTQQDDRWLTGYRRIAVIILLMVIMATLVRSYQVHREEAQQLTLTLLGNNLPSGHSVCTAFGSMSGARRHCMPPARGGSLMPEGGPWGWCRCNLLRKIAVSCGWH